MIRTRLTERLGLRYPVIPAPMARHSGSTLAAAVSKAGGLGTFGASLAGSGDWLRQEMARVRDATSAPFGVGFLTHRLHEEDESAKFDVALNARPPAMIFAFADPVDWIPRAKTAAVACLCQVQTVKDADEAIAAGADVLIAQGNQAGGHAGTADLFILLPALIERYPDVPIVAAGGIASARTIAALLAMGADGVMMGTRFLASPEAVEVSDLHKQVIVRSGAGETVFSRAFDILSGAPWPDGIGARGYRNRFFDSWAGREDEMRGRIEAVRAEHAALVERSGPEQGILYMGTSVEDIDAVEPVATIIESLFDGAEQLLRRNVVQRLEA